jgi:hypothetical protein
MSETEHEQNDEPEAPEAPEPDDEQDEQEEADENEHAADGGPSEADRAPASGKSDAEMERTMKRLEQSATTWRNRVSALLEESAQDLVPCELCLPIIPGFHWPAEVEQPRDATHARLLSVLKTPEGPPLKAANNTRSCDHCDGYGRVLSGSKVASHREINCSNCGGKGYLGGPTAQTNGGVSIAFTPDAIPASRDDEPPTDVDSWGIPRLLEDGTENPNFGRTPQFWNPSYPVGRVG